MNCKVAFRPRATADLDDVYDFIARDSSSAAIAFVRRIREHCAKLAWMAERGPRRDDLAAGIRILPFEAKDGDHLSHR